MDMMTRAQPLCKRLRPQSQQTNHHLTRPNGQSHAKESSPKSISCAHRLHARARAHLVDSAEPLNHLRPASRNVFMFVNVSSCVCILYKHTYHSDVCARARARALKSAAARRANNWARIWLKVYAPVKFANMYV